MESSQENKSPILLSAVFSVDEFPWNDYVPWKEALHSILNFVDECIVVHGGKEPAGPSLSAKKYITELKDPRIRIVEFPLPKAGKFNWMQLAGSLTYGYLHCRGRWCFRVLMDEVFPEEFFEVRALLDELPPEKKIVSVGRHYLLGISVAFPYRDKPLFFRRNTGLAFGKINPKQEGPLQDEMMFDDPVDTSLLFDGEKVISSKHPTFIERQDAKEKLLSGEVPEGYRDRSNKHVYQWGKAFLNTDVNFFPDEFIIDQKWQSIQGYQNLPEPYRGKIGVNKKDVLVMHMEKIRYMAASKNYYKVEVPKSLIALADRHANISNVVRKVVETEYGLKWCNVNDRRSWNKKMLEMIKLIGKRG